MHYCILERFEAYGHSFNTLKYYFFFTGKLWTNKFTELLSESSGEFENFVRMSFFDFEYLLNKVAPIIAKQDTQLRHAIPPEVRLAITLRFLATGDNYKSLHFLFKVSSQLISTIIPEVCAAINEALKDEIKVNCFITIKIIFTKVIISIIQIDIFPLHVPKTLFVIVIKIVNEISDR